MSFTRQMIFSLSCLLALTSTIYSVLMLEVVVVVLSFLTFYVNVNSVQIFPLEAECQLTQREFMQFAVVLHVV